MADAAFCAACGHALPAAARFCPGCGAGVPYGSVQPGRTRAQVACAALGVSGAMALALTVVQAADLSLAHRIASGEYVSPAAVAAADRHLRLVAGLTLLADIVCAVAFIAWLWRAYTNAQVLTGGSDHGRGWTVGAWFVPLVNLVLPCLLVREAWRRTAGRGGELVLWWWALYAGPGTLALVVFATVPRTSVQLIELRQVAGLAADSCGAIAAALAVVMVWQLTALQAGGAGSSAVAGAGPGAGPAGSGSALDPVA